MAKSFMMMFMLIPTAITIWLAIEMKRISTEPHYKGSDAIQIVCFDADTCVIEVQGKWYHVSGVIDMDTIIPEEYKLNEIVDDAIDTPQNETN